MKNFFIFLLIAAAAYFAYDLIREKDVLEINASKVINTSNSIDIEAPALMPSHSGSVQGTIKNISGKTVTDILLRYLLDGQPVEASVYSLEPGEEKSFSTQTISVRGTGAAFYLEGISYK